MRHNVIYLFGALAILASCAKEVEKTEEPVVPAGKEQVTIIAQTPQTRTTAEVDGTNVDFSWQENETIAVVEQDAVLTTAEALTAAQFTVADADNGTFTGTKTQGKDLVFAVSPAQDLASANMSSGTSYTITLPEVYENYVPGTTNAVMIGTQSGEASGDVYPFRFAHAAALVKVTYVNVPVGTKKLGFTADKNINGSFTFTTTEGVTIETPNEGSATTWLELATAVDTPNQTMDFYIPVPAATYTQFSIALYKVEDNDDVVIAETKKKKSSSTELAVGDMFVTPTVTLPEVAYYVKVTSAPSDWSGDYLIVYQANDNSTSGEVLTGVSSSNTGEHTSVAISNSKILANKAYNVKIEKSGNSNNYTMKLGSKYLAYTGTSQSSNNYLYAVDNASTNGTLWTLSLDDAHNVYNTYRYLRYNTNSPRFCCYTSGQSKIKFYKLEDNTVWDLKSIAVTTAPTKTTYDAGEFFNPAGLIVTPTFEEHGNASNTKVGEPVNNADLTFTPSTTTQLTTNHSSVTISYTVNSITKTTTQAITVNPVYAITIDENIGHGSVEADKSSAAEGATVTLTPTPESGYTLQEWNVYKTGDTSTEVTVNNNGTFTMPAYPVTVSASFEESSGSTTTITYENFTNTSYNTTESTFTKDEISFGYVNAMRNGSNGTPQGWAKDQVIQTKSGGTIYNTTSMGSITKIRVYTVVNTNSFTITSGSSKNPSTNQLTRPDTPTGTESITYSSYTSNGKIVTPGQTTTANYYDFTISNQSFFEIAPGGSLYIYKIEITYTK